MRKIKILFLIILMSFFLVSCGEIIHLDDARLAIEEKFLELNDVNFVIDDLVLFDYVEKYPKMEITWYSNNPKYISDSGIVSRPLDKNIDVMFTAHFRTSSIYPGKFTVYLNVIASKIEVNIDDNIHYVTDGKGYTLENGYENEGMVFLYYIDNNNNIYYPNDVIIESKTLTSVYDSREYQVTYLDFDDSIFFSYFEKYGHTARDIKGPEREGYIFLTWDPLVDVVRGETIYQAVYKEISYDVTFYDSSYTVYHKEKVLYNNSVIKPKDPKRENAIFIGWFLDDVLYDFDDIVTKNLSLKAKFEYLD